MPPDEKTIFEVVARIPEGQVATYGAVARAAGFPRHARLVGFVLSTLSDDDPLPWHRVVNARGEISTRRDRDAMTAQRRRLEAEGVGFDGSLRVDLRRYGCDPSQLAPRPAR